MMGGSHYGFGDTSAMSDRTGAQSPAQSPWTNQSDSSLARDAGINDIGASRDRTDNDSRAGLFDSASNDDDQDDMDMDSDDYGGGDSDFA
jgi:uncharacterized protein